jgi:hypothetical protein
MLLALTLTALLSAPRAPADAELVTHVPRLDGLSTLLPFFDAAGARAALLRPATWRAEAHPLLEFDVTDATSLEAAGIDARASLTVSRAGGASISCVTLKDVKRYVERCGDRLRRLGDVTSRVEGGVTIVGARDPLNRVLGGYVLRGAESCAAVAHGGTLEKQLPALAKTLAKTASGPGFALAQGLPGVAQVVVPKGGPIGALTLSGDGLTLTANAKAKGLTVAPLSGAGTSPFAQLAPPGLAVVRARLSPMALAPVLTQVVGALPNAGSLAPLVEQAAPLLTGNVALYAARVKVTRGLRTREARYFAVRHVLLAEVKDPAAAKALVDAVKPGALTSRDGTIELGLSGKTLYLSNDTAARDAALGALEGASGAQAHAGEAVVDPRRLAEALAQVPLLEALQAPELAALVAAATELGPLLLASKRVEGWVDAAGPGQHRAQATWQLDEAKLPGTGRSPSAP